MASGGTGASIDLKSIGDALACIRTECKPYTAEFGAEYSVALNKAISDHQLLVTAATSAGDVTSKSAVTFLGNVKSGKTTVLKALTAVTSLPSSNVPSTAGVVVMNHPRTTGGEPELSSLSSLASILTEQQPTAGTTVLARGEAAIARSLRDINSRNRSAKGSIENCRLSAPVLCFADFKSEVTNQLLLIDTAGVNEANLPPAVTDATESVVRSASVLTFVCDYTMPKTTDDESLWRRLCEWRTDLAQVMSDGRLIVVVNKFDFANSQSQTEAQTKTTIIECVKSWTGFDLPATSIFVLSAERAFLADSMKRNAVDLKAPEFAPLVPDLLKKFCGGSGATKNAVDAKGLDESIARLKQVDWKAEYADSKFDPFRERIRALCSDPAQLKQRAVVTKQAQSIASLKALSVAWKAAGAKIRTTDTRERGVLAGLHDSLGKSLTAITTAFTQTCKGLTASYLARTVDATRKDARVYSLTDSPGHASEADATKAAAAVQTAFVDHCTKKRSDAVAAAVNGVKRDFGPAINKYHTDLSNVATDMIGRVRKDLLLSVPSASHSVSPTVLAAAAALPASINVKIDEKALAAQLLAKCDPAVLIGTACDVKSGGAAAAAAVVAKRVENYTVYENKVRNETRTNSYKVRKGLFGWGGSKWIHENYTVAVPYSEAVAKQRVLYDAKISGGGITCPMKIQTPSETLSWADTATKPIADTATAAVISGSITGTNFAGFIAWLQSATAALDRRLVAVTKIEALWLKVAAAAKLV